MTPNATSAGAPRNRCRTCGLPRCVDEYCSDACHSLRLEICFKHEGPDGNRRGKRKVKLCSSEVYAKYKRDTVCSSVTLQAAVIFRTRIYGKYDKVGRELEI